MSVMDKRQFLSINREHRGARHKSYYQLINGRYKEVAAFRLRIFWNDRLSEWAPITLKESYNDSDLSYTAARTRISKVVTYEIKHVTDEEMEEVFNDYFPTML